MVEFIGLIYSLVLGAVITSFTNVVGLRVPRKQSIVTPRSHCPSCGHVLSAWELIPVFGYVFLRGKCRGCGGRIAPTYPLFELLGAVGYAYSFWLYGFSLTTILAFVFLSTLLALAMSDLSTMLVPNVILLFTAPVLIVLAYGAGVAWWSPIAGAALGFSVLATVFFVSKGGLGAGDVKLFTVIGLVLGPRDILVALFLSSLIGAIVGLTLIGLKRMDRKQPIPFVPSIALGTMLTFWFSERFFDWYFDLM
ncbi:prepilin peptidase [Exiguobacterium mexicanum]|uniref:prepilin peptidase n=1 Tax=Exiguobacterium mexicanum TaxID=340146 RepID=UPI00110DB464|nr:A24 family peptidase [Exiguobacterium mexicanum]